LPSATQKRWLMIAAGLLLSAAAVAFFVGKLRGHWEDFSASFAQANYLYLVPALGFIAMVYVLRVLRWRMFLSPMARVAYRDIAGATLIGFMSTCVLPLRPGEVIRPYVLHKRSGIKFGVAAGTAVGLERVFDLIGAFFLLVLALALMGSAAPGGEATHLAEGMRQKGLYLAAAALCGLAALMALALAPGAMLRVASFFLRVLPQRWRAPLMAFLESVATSMQFLRSPVRVAGALALTLAFWLCYPLSTYSLALGFNLHLPFVGALLAQVILTAAVAVPQAPGFIGVFSVAAMVGVELFGVPKGDAAAFATMLWAINVIPITIVGLGVLWWQGLSLGRLKEEARQLSVDG
jgi:uncharacterized membrane protein YbhN (UPF0104 family)